MRPPAPFFPLALAVVVAGCADEPTGPEPRAPELWTDVATGADHACGLTDDGQAWCWGAANRGQLGHGGNEASAVPVRVLAETPFERLVVAGDRSCGLTADGEAWCWGRNILGQMGDGRHFDLNVPAPVAGGHRFEQVSLGPYFGCGRVADGGLWCWGGERVDAMFGGLTPGECLREGASLYWNCSGGPVQVLPELRFSDVSVGVYHVCGTLSSGVAGCWGENGLYQVGAETSEECAHRIPVACTRSPVNPEPSLERVVAGATHSCGFDASDQVLCWGGVPLDFGQLGRGGRDQGGLPEKVVGGHRFAGLALSNEDHIHTFSCGIDADLRGWCWGAGGDGQLGAAAPDECPNVACALAPVSVGTDRPLVEVDPGDRFACGLTADGAILCWGRNEAGQLGDGTTVARAGPREVPVPAG